MPPAPGPAPRFAIPISPPQPRRRFGLVATVLLLAGTLPLAACTPPAAAQRGAGLPDFADLAERVLPAVVNIAVTSEQRAEIPPELRGTPFERQYRDRFRGRREQMQGAGESGGVGPVQAHGDPGAELDVSAEEVQVAGDGAVLVGIDHSMER